MEYAAGGLRPLGVGPCLPKSKLACQSNVVTAGALHCWKVMIMLQSLTNVVNAWANGRLLGVGSYGRANGLLQKPALPSCSQVAPGRHGWLQARWVGETLISHSSWTRRLRRPLFALAGSWLNGACFWVFLMNEPEDKKTLSLHWI